MDSEAKPSSTVEAAQWPRKLARYRDPSTARSVLELALTVVPLIAIWVIMWLSLAYGPWLCLLLTIPATAFIVRLFMIQHDCGHGSFFPSRALNDWVGRIIGVFTLTPYAHWRRIHSIHHSASGNLDARGIGDVNTLTVREYLALGRWQRFAYRFYRHPLFLFGLAPSYVFMLQQRVPLGFFGQGWQPWKSPMGTNVALVALHGSLIWLIGLPALLWIYLPTAALASSVGVWLFYVQHQFEETYWEGREEWRHPDASLHGSSHYVLPGILRWFSANIGVHHVHHLNSRIPFYRLPEPLRDYPEIADIGRLTLKESFACVRLTLWDEDHHKMISFRDLKASQASGERPALSEQLRDLAQRLPGPAPAADRV